MAKNRKSKTGNAGAKKKAKGERDRSAADRRKRSTGKHVSGAAKKRRSGKPVGGAATRNSAGERDKKPSRSRPRGELAHAKAGVSHDRRKKAQPVPKVGKAPDVSGSTGSQPGAVMHYGRPKAGEEANTLRATKPWLAAGISRATYFRQKKNAAS